MTRERKVRCVSPVLQTRKGMIPFLLLLARLLLVQARRLLALLASRTHSCLVSIGQLTSTPRSFSARQLSSHCSPSLFSCKGSLCSKCCTQHLALLNAIQLDTAHRSSLSRSLCGAFLASARSTVPPKLVSWANSMRVVLPH